MLFLRQVHASGGGVKDTRVGRSHTCCSVTFKTKEEDIVVVESDVSKGRMRTKCAEEI